MDFCFQSLSIGSRSIIKQINCVFEASSFNLRAIVWIKDLNCHGLEIVVLDCLSEFSKGSWNRSNVEWHVNQNFSLTGESESREIFVYVCYFLIVLIIKESLSSCSIHFFLSCNVSVVIKSHACHDILCAGCFKVESVSNG